MFENFERNISNFTGNFWAFMGSTLVLGGGLGFMVVDNIVMEDFDNTPTELTQSSYDAFQNNIEDMVSVTGEQDILSARQKIFEHDHSIEGLERGSAEWVDYKVQEDIFKEQKGDLSQKLKTGHSDFFNALMTNKDITEENWEGLVSSFQEADIGRAGFPGIDSAYTLKECQLEVINSGATDVIQAEGIKLCMTDEQNSDVNTVILAGLGGGALLSLIGLATLNVNAERIQTAARRRRSRKQHKKPTN